MSSESPTERYEAVLYTAEGVRTKRYFDDGDVAHQWITKEYAALAKADSECACAIYDREEDEKRILVVDHWLLLPSEPRKPPQQKA
jgi:hypothetical protein